MQKQKMYFPDDSIMFYFNSEAKYVPRQSDTQHLTFDNIRDLQRTNCHIL